MANIELQALICVVMTSYTSASRCEGYYKNCCPGSAWNSETEKCERCIAGFSGSNCSAPCPYPYYGVECQRTCNCRSNLCDVSSGCTDVSTNIEDTEKCYPGYVGKYCRAKCIYPYYGEECEAECNCSKPMCDVTNGCKAVNKAGQVTVDSLNFVEANFRGWLEFYRFLGT